jgi:hypothetical protein
MEDKIQELLRLSSIPNFKLLDSEQELLDNWKAEQEKITPEEPKELTPEETESGIGSDGKLTVKNIVEDKTQ